MKKLSLLVALAVLVSFGAFAQVSLDYAVTGSATMTWGMDLDTAEHGFLSETASTMDLSITLDPSEVTASGSGVYGEITLSGFGVAIGDGQGVKWGDAVKSYDKDGDNYGVDDPAVNSDFATKIAEGQEEYDYTWIQTGIAVTTPDVAAKIVLSDALFLQIASNPNFNINFAAEAVDGDGFASNDIENKGGVLLGYMSDIADVNVQLATQNNWEAGDDGADATRYAFGADVTVKPADIVTLTAAVNYTELYDGPNDDGDPIGTDTLVGVNVDLTPIDMLSVNLGFDALLGDDTAMDLDISIPVTVTDAISVTAAGSYVTTGADGDDGKVDAKLSAAMTGDFALSVDVMLDDVMTTAGDDLQFDLEVAGSYNYALSDSTYIKPGFSFGYDMNYVDNDREFESNSDDKKSTFNAYDADTNPTGVVGATADNGWDEVRNGEFDDEVTLEVYLEAGLIDNTVFTLKYATDQLLSDDYYTGNDPGVFTFATVISY